MGVIPNTGAEITMGRVYKAYTNVTATAGSNITLTGTLGTNIGHTINTQLSFSSGFGGRTTPFTY